MRNHHSYFFREPSQLDLFAREVLPGLAAKQDRPLRLLSAGCASGEEAYTLAILVAESPSPLARQSRILGVDLDEAAVARARHGIYPESAFQATDRRTLARWFRQEGDTYRILTAAKERVSFRTGDLFDLGGWADFRDFDAIFCRNLLIYFDPAAQERLVELLFAALAPGGALLVGHAEGIPPLAGRFDFKTDGRACYYLKPDGRADTCPALSLDLDVERRGGDSNPR